MPLTPGHHYVENYYRIIVQRRLATDPRTGRQHAVQLLRHGDRHRARQDRISILSAYAVVYFRFPFRMTAFWIIFITLMLPVEVRIYPTYKVVADLQPARHLRRPDRCR